VNAIIPWAAVQRASKWVGGDPNPGTAIRMDDNGHFRVQPGYHFYKQVCRAGQPGMAVSRVAANDSEISLIAFASNGTRNPDAFVVMNLSNEAKSLDIAVVGSASRSFAAYRTSPNEQYVSLGERIAHDGVMTYGAPPGSVTTFYGAS
jgi:hypothetical protein